MSCRTTGSTTQMKKKVVRQRGPSRGVTVQEPMFLKFDEFDNPKGEWSLKYAQQIGQCATRIDINIDSYCKLDEVDKKQFWEETKV